jgi:hypothetical protein
MTSPHSGRTRCSRHVSARIWHESVACKNIVQTFNLAIYVLMACSAVRPAFEIFNREALWPPPHYAALRRPDCVALCLPGSARENRRDSVPKRMTSPNTLTTTA